MRQLKARDIMTANPFSVTDTMTLQEVVHTFCENSVASAPIVSKSGDILGLLTEYGLMKALLIHQALHHEKKRLSDFPELFESAHLIREDEGTDAILKGLMKSPEHHLLVIDSTERLAGVVDCQDVLRALDVEAKNFRKVHGHLDEVTNRITASGVPAANGHDLVNFYQEFFKNAPYMMHSVDAHGIIILANEKTHAMLGYSPGELLGRSVRDLYIEKHWGQAEQGLKTLIKGNTFDSVLTSMKHKTGEVIPVEIRTSTVRDAHGGFHGTISIARRIDNDPALKAVEDLLDPKTAPPPAGRKAA